MLAVAATAVAYTSSKNWLTSSGSNGNGVRIVFHFAQGGSVRSHDFKFNSSMSVLFFLQQVPQLARPCSFSKDFNVKFQTRRSGSRCNGKGMPMIVNFLETELRILSRLEMEEDWSSEPQNDHFGSVGSSVDDAGSDERCLVGMIQCHGRAIAKVIEES